ncbi:MAG TPA: fatty acid CoA ligase family protein [Victivallales bacterium]|nr:fatty acid CoA ligase family protein [Victivallales bacterium]
MDSENHNVAAEFFRTALSRADDLALFYKGRPVLGETPDQSLSFAELAKIANFLSCEFRNSGISSGDKTLVMLRYSPEFIATVFALFSLGAVPVLIDPGMGFSRLLHCISNTKPRALVAIPLVHWVKFFRRSCFSSVDIVFSIKGFTPPLSGIRKIPHIGEMLSAKIANPRETLRRSESDIAAIVFTTGSTGPAKGVEYTHGIFKSQLGMISEYYGAGPAHIDMPCFPLFAMFSLCLGMPCVIPDIDPSRPAKASPETIVNTVKKHKVSFSFASPTLWRRVADYCQEKNIRLDTLRKVLMAGAPVPASIHESIRSVISPDGDSIVPYGATESLPIANFSGKEMLAETACLTAQGRGYCVGRPVKECETRIIRPVDGNIKNIDEVEFIPNGEIGEIIVKGPVVTARYHQNTEATELAKIADGARIWHRMGDMGYFDNDGRLWFCGRKNHLVKTKDGVLYPVCCEAPFNIFTKRRCALVGKGEANKETPVLVVEADLPEDEFEKLKESLRNFAARNEVTKRISHFAQMRNFPVDIRHNAKISREKIRAWIAS